MKKRIVKMRLVLEDILLINLAYILGLYIKFESITDPKFLFFLSIYWANALIINLLKVFTFYYFNMYKTIWRYASIKELFNIVIAIIISNTLVISVLFINSANMDKSIHLIVLLLDLVLIGGVRFSYRTIDITALGRRFKNAGQENRIMIIGAGDAGVMVGREYRNHPQLNAKPVVMIDDDVSKQGRIINGLLVAGGRKDIVAITNKYRIDEIVIAIPSATKRELRGIIENCKKTKAKLKIVPGLYELINGKVSIQGIRDVQIEDVLGREEIKIDLKAISFYITGKVIMVTGGGGSIGSELVRQISKFKPKKLIIFDIYENSAYDIQNEILRKHKDLNSKVLIGSIRDRNRIEEIFKDEKPEVVFHAAAHKHVPLMESSPKEAIKNNVFGTLNLAQLANEYKVDKFVMISTDKAVNPTNVMGASKRICEMIVQSLDINSRTEYVSVRFGNVLGSNGSVIPLFKKQIADGGPVTVTHKDIIRYFMTIPEAVQLVIQAGAMAEGGEIFVLDMGEPVKILDLAKDVIRLSGLEPNRDIEIEITGLRPGEKLFEELLLDEEGIENTKHKKIFIGRPIFTDYKLLLKSLEELKLVLDRGSNRDLIDQVKTIVPTYKDNEEVNNRHNKDFLKEEVLNR